MLNVTFPTSFSPRSIMSEDFLTPKVYTHGSNPMFISDSNSVEISFDDGTDTPPLINMSTLPSVKEEQQRLIIIASTIQDEENDEINEGVFDDIFEIDIEDVNNELLLINIPKYL